MKTKLKKINTWIKTHKIWSSVIFILIIVIGYWLVHRNTATAETKYILGTVEKGNIVASVSGTGQISASNQVDVTSKSSGDLIYLKAHVGDEVKAGAFIAETDPGNSQYEYETAKLSYDRLVANQPNTLRDTENSVTQAEEDLNSAYADAQAAIAKGITNLIDTGESLHDLFVTTGYLTTAAHSGLSDTQKSYITNARSSYFDANDTLKELTKQFHTISTSSSHKEILAVLDRANEAAEKMAQAAKYSQDAVVFIRNSEHDNNNSGTTAYNNVVTLVSSANSTASELSAAQSTITKNEHGLETAQSDLTDFNSGTRALDLRAETLSLKQKQDAYQDHFVTAPFDGVIAAVPVRLGKSITSGTTIATLITKEKIAEISLNEVDATKIKAGQKATLTFDAIEGLTLTGKVIEIDLVGTVSQGVVSYNTKIGLDTNDDRVKSGMTVTANIITDSRQDVVVVSSSAIKTQGDISYVQVVPDNVVPTGQQTGGVTLASAPELVEVTTGLSNDDSVEITSGLNIGEHYIARTINASSQTTAAPSLFGGARNTGTTRPRGATFGG